MCVILQCSICCYFSHVVNSYYIYIYNSRMYCIPVFQNKTKKPVLNSIAASCKYLSEVGVMRLWLSSLNAVYSTKHHMDQKIYIHSQAFLF